MISLIAAMTNQRVIGKGNKMPWHLPADLAHFKRITLGKPVVMGRKTFESIGKPLPGRRNIVVSRSENLQLDKVECFHSLQAALDAAAEGVEEVMVIGGANIYEQTLPIADRLYLTIIDTQLDGDTFFPEWIKADWQTINCEQHLADEKNPFNYQFLLLKRKEFKNVSSKVSDR